MSRTARVVAFSTTAEMAAQIDALACEEGRSRSGLLREAFRTYLGASSGASGADACAAEARVAYGVPTAAPAAPGSSGLLRVLALREEIRTICHRLGVRRLWLYGSAVREDFAETRSDVDMLVEWRTGDRRRAFRDFITLKEDLTRVVGLPVDLVEEGTIRNPYLREAIERERLLIHDET
jgi:predicted nucleotidyltransferase